MKIKLGTGHKVLKPNEEILKKVVTKLQVKHENTVSNIYSQTFEFHNSKIVIVDHKDNTYRVSCWNKTNRNSYTQVESFYFNKDIEFANLIKQIFFSSTDINFKNDLLLKFEYMFSKKTHDGFLLEKAEWI